MTDAPSDRDSLTPRCMWWEPPGDWLPIARAVFRFAITHSARPRSTETFQDDSNPFSIEALKKFKSRQDKADADIVHNETDPLSLYNLTATLRDKACARRAEIDLDEGYFRFCFDLPTGGAALMSYAPWHLDLPRDPVEIDPKLEWEARFNRGNGFVMVDDETATLGAQQDEAAHKATRYVWNQSMLPAFNRLVSVGRVKVYARVKSPVAQLQELPADLWLRLKVEDWQHGTARDAQADRYYSIHAADSLPQVSPPQAEASYEAATDAFSNKMPSSKRRTINARGRPKEYKWDTEIKAFTLDLVHRFGMPGEDNKKLPRSEDLVKAVQNELAKKDLHPGDSTVRRYVSKWLSEL
jgi:hypothetical protein